MHRRGRDLKIPAQIFLSGRPPVECLVTRDEGKVLTLQRRVPEADGRGPDQMSAGIHVVAQPRRQTLQHLVKLALGKQVLRGIRGLLEQVHERVEFC